MLCLVNRVLIILSISASFLSADFIGPDYSEITDISKAYEAKIGQRARVIGCIKYRIGDNTFLFEDKNGKNIKVRVPQKAWPAYDSVRPTSRLFLRGQIRYQDAEKIIVAKKIDIVKKYVSEDAVYKFFEFEY